MSLGLGFGRPLIESLGVMRVVGGSKDRAAAIRGMGLGALARTLNSWAEKSGWVA